MFDDGIGGTFVIALGCLVVVGTERLPETTRQALLPARRRR